MTQQQNPIRRRADGSIDTNHYASRSMTLRRQAFVETRRSWVSKLRAWLRGQGKVGWQQSRS